jgi:molybdenum cofactor synthesis domain-containing protein
MIPLEEAQRIVRDGCRTKNPVNMPVREALGCVLAKDIIAREAIPPFANSSMDGYALIASDTVNPPVRLKVIGDIAAGSVATQTVRPGEAMRIMTGAPMPDGADAVVMVEESTIDGDQVVIATTAPTGQFVRSIGDDVTIGEVVLVAGTVLRPAHLGVLASLGERNVMVYPRLVIGILSSGDELVEDGSPLKPGQIREANKELLISLVERVNAIPLDLGLARDTEEDLTRAFEDALTRCDALITSGGVSMGDFDLVKVTLDRLGKMQWMQIAIQPAKPFAFGLLGGEARSMPVFGLPGNPVSSMVSFELIARPAILKMMGHRVLDRSPVLAIADVPLRRRAGDGKINWQRVVAHFSSDGRLHLRSTGAQGSHQLANSAAANALVRLEDGPGAEEGDEVLVLLLD